MKAELDIQGMTCNHCVMSVRKELAMLEGLEVEDVQIGRALVEFDPEALTRQDIAAAIRRAGYSLNRTAAIQ